MGQHSAESPPFLSLSPSPQQCVLGRSLIARNAIHFSVITRKSVQVRKTENILLYPGSHSPLKERLTDWDGCYKELFEAECQVEVEEERLIVGQDLPDGVFTVERLASL